MDIYRHRLPIYQSLNKYKKSYFLSHQFIMNYSVIFLDEEYVIAISVKSFTSLYYWHLVITVTIGDNIDSDICQTFQSIFERYNENPKGILPRQKSLPQVIGPRHIDPLTFKL